MHFKRAGGRVEVERTSDPDLDWNEFFIRLQDTIEAEEIDGELGVGLDEKSISLSHVSKSTAARSTVADQLFAESVARAADVPVYININRSPTAQLNVI